MGLFSHHLLWPLDESSVAVAFVVGVSVVCLFIVFDVRKVLATKKPFDDLPMPPFSHWLLGHVRMIGGDYRTSFQTMTRDHANKCGQTGYWLLNQKAVSVTDYQDVRLVLNSTSYRKPVPTFRRHVNRFLGKRNIGVLVGKEWKFHRTLIVRAFAPAVVQDARPAILKVMSTFLSSLKALPDISKLQQHQNLASLMKMITIDIFGQAALSRDLGCCSKLEPSKIATAFDYMGSEMFRRIVNPLSLENQYYWIPTSRNRRHNGERAYLRGFLETLVQERLETRAADRPRDLLYHLLQDVEQDNGRKKNIPNETLSSETLSDMLVTLLFAGYDTTSTALTYALYVISTMPEVEEKCLEEIRNSDVTDPDALQYCKAVIMETLRLYPPGIATTRSLEKDLQVKGGFVIPAGTFMFMPIWLIQRMEQHFEKPLEFHPERWAYQDCKTGLWTDRGDADVGDGYPSIAPANRKAFFAFSGGGRACAGIKFAMTEAILVFAQLVEHLTFELPQGYELVPVRAGLVQHPRDPIHMKLQWRV